MSKRILSNMTIPFFQAESAEEKKNKQKSMLYTVLIFAFLFLMLILLGLKLPDQDKGPQGIEVMLGSYEAGFDQTDDDIAEPEDAAEESQEESTQLDDADADQDETEQHEASDQEAQHETFDTQDTDPLDDLEDGEEQETEQEETESAGEPEQEIDTMALYPGAERTPRGDREEMADAGAETGRDDTDSDVRRGETTRDDDGFSYDLGGRQMVKAPNIDDQTQKTGKVVVAITVDREGNVIHARPGIRGSTTSDPDLLNIARESAFDTAFEPDPDAPENQTGSMEFIFRLE